MKTFIIAALICVQITSCSKSTGSKSDPSLYFDPPDITISNGAQTAVTLNVADLDVKIFAVSMRLNYDPQMLSFDQNSGFVLGDLFDQNEISLVINNEGHIHVSLSLVQGTDPFKRDGSLATFTFGGMVAGTTQINIDQNELFFYDQSGNSLEMADLTVEVLAVSVE